MNYKYDYDRNSFFIINDSNGIRKYYLKVKQEYVEVNEDVFKVCIKSYDKIRKDEKNKAVRLILNFEDIDQAAFFQVDKKEDDLIHNIYINDLAQLAKREIYNLPKKYRNIAICIFLNDMTIKETSKHLKIANTTVYDRKVKIQKILQKKLKKTE